MFNHEKAIQEFESHCRNGKEIHGGNYLTMIGEKRKPALAWIAATPQSSYISRNSALGDLEAELQKFAMNLGAPQPVLSTAIVWMRFRISALIFGRPPAAAIASANTDGNSLDAIR